jgi:anti-sigma factor RsiW
MWCDETQQALSLYVDDRLAVQARAACDEHLRQCPLCRARLAELRSLSRELARLKRPQPPPDLAASISTRLGIEAAAQQRAPKLPLDVRLTRWLRPRLMPYTVGSFASVLLFFAMFSALRPHLRALREAAAAHAAAEQASLRIIYLTDEANNYPDITKPVRQDVYAAARAPYAIESPSLNPSGALAALTIGRSHGHRKDDDDDMVVVTDVFSNGSASLAGVVQAPRDPRMLDDFQSALRKDAAFVPASYDRRPETMRVVFVIQKIDVTDEKSQKF